MRPASPSRPSRPSLALGRHLALLAFAGVAACTGGGARSVVATECPRHLVVLLGACVSPRVAAAYCGPTGRAEAFGCAPLPSCAAGQARELRRGTCTPVRTVRAFAISRGIYAADDDLVTCEPGAELAVANVAGSDDTIERIGCLGADACPRGFRPARKDARDAGATDRAGCIREPACPPGAVLDLDGRTCRRVVADGIVDVALWLRAAAGPDGGEGSPTLCQALARAPSVLAAPAIEDVLEVTLRFPDNDLTEVDARAAVVSSSASTLPAELETELDRAVSPMIEALRALGSRGHGPAASAGAGQARVRVRCKRSVSRPMAGPRSPRDEPTAN